MRTSNSISSYEICDTIFAPGNGESSQVQLAKYTKNQKIITTTQEIVSCDGRNNLEPLNVIFKPFIGPEIADVNLHPFNSYLSLCNPYKWYWWARTRYSNRYFGINVLPLPFKASPESVKFHSIILSELSIGQVTDIQSHKNAYDAWLASENRSNGLVLYAVSRGTSTAICAFAKYKYPEVKLVILEGAIDSVENIIPKRFGIRTNLVYSGLSLFTKYDRNGPSPLKSVPEFPENIPVVFITSKMDTQVSCQNTENIAQTLANKGKNDVFLLKLERSSHPNYMFDDKKDRDMYEAFIHAIYKKYNLQHDAELAAKGASLVEACKLEPERCELKKVV